MLKKILSNTIVRLILAVLIGLLVGLVVNEPVLKAVMIIKQITGQIIFFLVPLIILSYSGQRWKRFCRIIKCAGRL